MSIFTIKSIEHLRNLTGALDVGAAGARGAAKVNPPIKTGLNTYGGRPPAYKNPAAALQTPKKPIKPIKPKIEPIKPKVEPIKPKIEPIKPKVDELASPKVIDDLKVSTKDIDIKVKNTMDDLTNAGDNFKKTSKENMWKFKDELEEPLKGVYKQIDEGGSIIPKGPDGGPVVKGKVQADEINSNLKKLEENPPVDLDDAVAKTKKVTDDRIKQLDDELESDTFKKTKEWANDHKLLVGGVGVAALVAGGIAIAAAVKQKEKEDATYNIVSIDDISTSSLSLAKITFTPGEKISRRDYLMFTGTNCDPPLPPDCEIYKIDSEFQVQVMIPKKLTKNGTSGTMKIKTSFGNQYSLLLTEATKEIANIAGEAAGAAIQGAGEITKDVAKTIWEELGLPDLTEYWWVLLIICILCISSSAVPVVLQIIQNTT